MKVIALAIDNETTGFDPIAADVISTGMVEILEDYTLGRKKAFYSRPRSTKYFSDGAQEIHGISYWKAATFPKAEDTCIEMLHWLKPLMDYFPLTTVMHANGNFDLRFLDWHFRKSELLPSFTKAFSFEKTVNTIKMAKNNIVHLENFKLSTVAKHYDIELDHHEVLSDTIACAKIYCNIEQNIGVNTGRLF